MKEIDNKAVWIYCRNCGCEYLEERQWVLADGLVECPNCKNKLRIT